MNRRFLRRLGLGLALAASAAASQAGTVTFNNWTWGNGNTVNVSSPAYNGVAGGFTATLSGFGAGFDGLVDTYCVDIVEHFSFGVAYGEYQLVTAASHFGTTKANALGRLITYVYGNHLFASAAAGAKDDQSTALQVAIWNTVYDNDATLGGGTFIDTSAYKTGSAAYVGANDLLLTPVARSQPIGYELFVLKSDGHQDQLIWRQATVPEPAGWALAGLALAAAALATRRRRG